MKRLALAILAWLLFSFCAVNAQQVPGQGGAQVPVGPLVPTGVVQNNPNSASAPTANNDSTQGYSVGSIWQQSTTGRVWIARSVAVGAAVWTLTDFFDHPGYIANNWYLPAGQAGALFGSASAPGAGSIRLVPGYIRERVTLSALGVRITTASAGGNVQAAIYANNFTTMRPTGLALASTVSISTASTGSVNAAVSVQLEPGIYWFATNSDNSTVVFATLNVSSPALSEIIGSASQSASLGNGQGLSGVTVAQTFGTWPDLTSGSFAESTGQNVPVVQFQVTSVP